MPDARGRARTRRALQRAMVAVGTALNVAVGEGQHEFTRDLGRIVGELNKLRIAAKRHDPSSLKPSTK